MASASGPSRLQWYTKWYTGGLFSLNPTVRKSKVGLVEVKSLSTAFERHNCDEGAGFQASEPS